MKKGCFFSDIISYDFSYINMGERREKMNYEINLGAPLVLPTTVTTKEEFDDYLDAVHNAFLERRKSQKWLRLLVKILMSTLCVMSLLLSIVYPFVLILSAATGCFAIVYKMNPTSLTMQEKVTLKSLNDQYKLRMDNSSIVEGDVEDTEQTTNIRNIKKIENNRKFAPSRKAGSLTTAIYLDEVSNKFKIVGAREKTNQIFSYSDLIDCELIEDGNSIIKTSALPKAIAGGILFGGIGAVVGGITGKQTEKKYCNKLSVKFTVKNCKYFSINLDLIKKKTKKDSKEYKKAFNLAQEILSAAKVIQS